MTKRCETVKNAVCKSYIYSLRLIFSTLSQRIRLFTRINTPRFPLPFQFIARYARFSYRLFVIVRFLIFSSIAYRGPWHSPTLGVSSNEISSSTATGILLPPLRLPPTVLTTRLFSRDTSFFQGYEPASFPWL